MSNNEITETSNTCVICLDNISGDSETFEIECGHKYHTSCIINWFRNGYKSCPLCNDIPSNINEDQESLFRYSFTTSQLGKQRLQNIRKIGNRKNANPEIKKDFLKLKDFKNEGKESLKKLSAFKRTPEYKNAIKMREKLRKKTWVLRRKIQRQELKILTSYPLLSTY
tara:strand:- start:29 stop:532 length:504 start_codon:yes stop_codon:yes gene_type:complete